MYKLRVFFCCFCLLFGKNAWSGVYQLPQHTVPQKTLPNEQVLPNQAEAQKPFIVNNKNVIVYRKQNCQACDQAERYLNSRGIPFQVFDIRQDRETFRQYLLSGAGPLPVIAIDKQFLRGFSQSVFDRLYLKP